MTSSVEMKSLAAGVRPYVCVAFHGLRSRSIPNQSHVRVSLFNWISLLTGRISIRSFFLLDKLTMTTELLE